MLLNARLREAVNNRSTRMVKELLRTRIITGRRGFRCLALHKMPPHHSCHAPRRRGIQYAAASRVNHFCLGVLGRPVKPGDDTGERVPRPRHCEERSDEAIQTASAEGFWIASSQGLLAMTGGESVAQNKRGGAWPRLFAFNISTRLTPGSRRPCRARPGRRRDGRSARGRASTRRSRGRSGGRRQPKPDRRRAHRRCRP
ncbi:hypothetical protein IQ17_03979 [Bradyrhizobium daqingense]|uniref:Uncharacterized protein n=1 Tax=Bradyrhizobium daqingense TaxID=993502 RepID=A0A562L8X9_9BRAD|nr:hypothetical protein IQ17_03979 [Bradyrhizobium daqingense]